MVRTMIWAVEVESAWIADYGTFKAASEAGFDPAALIADDHLACQAEAARLQERGFQGVIAPSAALPGRRSLTLFGPRVRSEWGQPRRLASSMPCCAVATGGPAPAILFPSRIRYFGAAHTEFAAFAAAHT
jgi:hypothetical protein